MIVASYYAANKANHFVIKHCYNPEFSQQVTEITNELFKFLQGVFVCFFCLFVSCCIVVKLLLLLLLLFWYNTTVQFNPII